MTTLLINGRVHSPAAPDATAIAFGDGPDGTVMWLGADDTARAEFPDAEVVDLDGAFVAPAFVDSHVHLTATGLSLTGLDLRSATSRAHCLSLLAAHAAAQHEEGDGHEDHAERGPDPPDPHRAIPDLGHVPPHHDVARPRGTLPLRRTLEAQVSGGCGIRTRGRV